jgi:signal transduction histidine kinase
VVAAVFAHLILAYPSGRLTSRLDIGFVVVTYAYTLAMPLVQLTVAPADELFGGCLGGSCPSRPPLASLNEVLFDNLQSVNQVVDGILVAGFLVLVARHVIRASGRRRRLMIPIAVVAAVVAVNFAVEAMLPNATGGAWDVPDLLDHAAQLGVAVTFFFVLYASRLERSHVADALAQLAAAPPKRIESLLSRMLHDPTVRLGRWDPERAEYQDSAGAPLAERSADKHLATTRVDGPDGRLGLLVHDPAVLDDPRLLTSVIAATRLALDNARLNTQLEARLAEARASRARLIRAEDEARRRLERDLHDGAQQRLLGIGLALQLARKEALDGSLAAELLDESEAELHAAIDELRDLAQGIHPTVLTDHGLAAAVAALARRLPIPVQICGTGPERLPAGIESAAYFLICEALQNTVKHAQAAHAVVRIAHTDGVLRVEVTDDGTGGADVAGGSGLRGMADRVEAVDGNLRLYSEPGQGTRVIAELPCG